MWTINRFRKRKLVLEITGWIEGAIVERVYFHEEELSQVIENFSIKYPSPRYEATIYEILDLDWEEEK